MVIAIDGPAGAGKSTVVARALAEWLGFTYLDSGATYRAVGLMLLERGGAASERANELEIELGDRVLAKAATSPTPSATRRSRRPRRAWPPPRTSARRSCASSGSCSGSRAVRPVSGTPTRHRAQAGSSGVVRRGETPYIRPGPTSDGNWAEGSLREAAMTKAKKDPAKPRRETKRLKLKKETVRDLEPDARGRQVKGGARIMSN